MLKSEQIQVEIDNKNAAIEQEAAIGQQTNHEQIIQWRNEISVLQMQLSDEKATEAQQQAHEGRVQEATTEITTRLDTLYLGGQTLRELCADEEAYQILKISFTQDYISQATKNSEVLTQVQSDAQKAIKEANDMAQALDEVNTLLIQDKHKLTIELDDITSKYKAATQQLLEAPSSEETEKLKQTVASLTAQLELKAKAEEPKGDAKSQIDAMVEARENRKVKITNLRLADPSGINTKDYLANNALTGEEMNIHSNYVKSFKEVSAAEAEQLRADEAARVAEQTATIPPSIEPLDVPQPEHVEEKVDHAEPGPIDQIQATTSEAATTGTGHTTENEMVQQPQESEVKPLMSNDDLHTRFERIERELNLKSFNDCKRQELKELVA